MAFDRSAFDDFLIRNGCVGFYEPPLKLKSGRYSDWYADLRRTHDSMQYLQEIARHITDYITDNGLKADYIFGVPEGATQIGAEVNRMVNHRTLDETSAAVLRAKVKDRGDLRDSHSVGSVDAGKTAILIEDVATTGGSISEKLMGLQTKGIIIECAITCVNRLEKRERPDGRSVKDFLEENYGVPYRWLTDAKTLLPKAYAAMKPGEATARRIEDYFEKYGVEPLKILQV